MVSATIKILRYRLRKILINTAYIPSNRTYYAISIAVFINAVNDANQQLCVCWNSKRCRDKAGACIRVANSIPDTD
jgi:hypothetical protein